MYRSVVLRGFLFLCLCLPPPLGAEVLLMPPVDETAFFSEEPEAFGAFASWYAFRLFLQREETPEYNKDYDLGLRAAVFSSPRTSVETLFRVLYENRQNPSSPLYFWPRSVTTDLGLRVSRRAGPAVAAFGYRHDCKHDIEDSIRDAVHDVLSAGVDVRFPALRGGATASFEGEYNLPAIFQGVDPEADRGRLSGGLKWDGPDRAWGSLGASAGASLLFRDVGTRVSGVEAVDADWALRAWWASPGVTGSCVLYLQAERLSDGWVSLETEPAYLYSAGILLAFSSKK